MKKVQLIVLACASLAAFISFSSSFAGNRPGALTLTVGGGEDYFASKRDVQNAGVGIVQVGYNFTQNWGIRGLAGFFRSKINRVSDDSRHVNGDLLALDGIYHIMPDKTFEPYVFAGVGTTGMNPTRYDANNEGNINAGVGVQAFLQRSFAFSFEGREMYTWVGGKYDAMLSAGVDVLVDFC